MRPPTDAEASAWLWAPRRFANRIGRWPLGWRVCLALAWMGLIWFLSSRQEVLPEGADSALWAFFANLAHAPLFGLLALWIGLASLPPSAVSNARNAPVPALGTLRASCIWILALAYAVLDEWHQSWVPGRDANLDDVVIDGLGAALVLWIAAYLAQARASAGGLRGRLLVGVALCALGTWILGLGAS